MSFLCPGSKTTWACAQHIWNWYLCLNSGLQLLELKSKFFQPPSSRAKWLYSYWNWLSGFLFPCLWPSNIDVRYKEIAIRTTSSNSWRQLQKKYCWWWHTDSCVRFSRTLIIMRLLEIAGNSTFLFLNYSQGNISVCFCISSFSLETFWPQRSSLFCFQHGQCLGESHFYVSASPPGSRESSPLQRTVLETCCISKLMLWTFHILSTCCHLSCVCFNLP